MAQGLVSHSVLPSFFPFTQREQIELATVSCQDICLHSVLELPSHQLMVQFTTNSTTLLSVTWAPPEVTVSSVQAVTLSPLQPHPPGCPVSEFRHHEDADAVSDNAQAIQRTPRHMWCRHLPVEMADARNNLPFQRGRGVTAVSQHQGWVSADSWPLLQFPLLSL